MASLKCVEGGGLALWTLSGMPMPNGEKRLYWRLVKDVWSREALLALLLEWKDERDKMAGEKKEAA